MWRLWYGHYNKYRCSKYLGVQHIHNLESSWVKEQLDSVFDDELPQAIKTGMIAKKTMELIQSYLKEHSNIPYVIDPVMLAKVVIH